MTLFTRTPLSRGLALLPLLLAALLLLGGLAAAEVALVLNPYAEVDWAEYGQYRANLHTHTTQSDGQMSPAQVIDEYHARGYRILALTDHNRCTWPWEDFGRSAGELGMLTFPSNELSRHHHTGCYFIVHETAETDLQAALAEVAEKGGLAMLFHPGRYWQPEAEDAPVPPAVVEEYVATFTAHPHVVGAEWFNQGDRYPHDRRLWDALLQRLMPERPVWGFANDDSHGLGHIGRDWNVFLLPRLEESELRQAMVSGVFYFATVSTHPAEQRAVEGVPQIAGIVHDPDTGRLTITATLGGQALPDDAIRWISNGEVIEVGPFLDYREVEGLGSYARAELVGSGGTAFTNPFGFRHN